MKQELQSTNFKTLLVGYTEWLGTFDRSEAVLTNYPAGLQEFFLFLEQEYRINQINNITKRHIEAFKTYLQKRVNKNLGFGGICNQTVNSILGSLNTFNRYIVDSIRNFNYGVTTDFLPVYTPKRIVLSQKEVLSLYDATFEPYPHKPSSIEFGQRDRVLIALLYGSGLRLSEASNIDLSDIDFLNKRLLVRNGKMSKPRYVPIPNKHLEDIRAYIEQGRYYFTERHHVPNWKEKNLKKTGHKSDEQALLLSIEGARLMHFGKRLEYLKDKAGIEKKVTPHVLRHSLGTHLYQNGLDLDKIRKILGHAQIDTTQIYVHISKQLENPETE